MTDSQGALQEFNNVRDRLVSILEDLAAIAEERDAKEMVWQDRKEPISQQMSKGLTERARNVAQKKRFKLAVVGEFSVGKSTFINALLGREILSVSFKQCTATKTVLTYGTPERFKVTYHDDLRRMSETYETKDLRKDLARFTSDVEAIPNDETRLKDGAKSLAKQIKEVEVTCSAEFLLKQEIDIVDTPGLGGVLTEHKEVTYALIPEMDATMFLFPSDPGIGENDILFLRFMREHIKQIFFVMTKSDAVSNAEERAERAKFHQTSIQIHAGFAEGEMRQVYPVSARTELASPNSYPSESGFPEVVRELVDFLVRSSGVARLDAPLEYARAKQKALLESTEKDLRDIDKDLETLKDELFQMENEQRRIDSVKKDILADIKRTIDDMKVDGTDGIDYLPIILQRKVEEAIDSCKRDQLKKIDQLLEIVIKEEVNKWVNSKITMFESKQQYLQRKIDAEMKSIIEQLEAIESRTSRKSVTDVEVPTSSKLFTKAAWGVSGRMAGKAALVGGSMGGVMLGTILIGTITGIVVLPILLLVGLPIAAALAAFSGDAITFTKRTQQKLKEDLKKPVPPGGLTIYDLVVKGGATTRGYQPGLERSMREAVSNWGNELQNNVEEWVANQIDVRLTHLRKRITEKQSGKFNREQNLERFKREITALQELDRQLLKVETNVEDLREGKYTTQTDEEGTPADAATENGQES